MLLFFLLFLTYHDIIRHYLKGEQEMLVNPNISEELYEYAGQERVNRARNYQRNGKVSITKVEYTNMDNFEIKAMVYGNYDNYEVYIQAIEGELECARCECPDYESHYGACKHIVATMLEFNGNPKYNSSNFTKTKTKEKYTDFKDLLNTFYEEIEHSLNIEHTEVVPDAFNIQIVPKIRYDKFDNECKVEFKIGNKQLYKLKDLPEFYNRMLKQEHYKYGAKLEFTHTPNVFFKESEPLLNFILKYAEIIKYVNGNSNAMHRFYGRALSTEYITLSNSGIDEFFEILQNQTVLFEKDDLSTHVEFVPHEPQIEFDLVPVSEHEFKLICPIETYNTYNILQGKDYTYLLIESQLYRCNKNYENSVIKLLEVFRRNFTREIKFNKENLYNFFSMVVPKVKKYINLANIDEAFLEQYLPQRLGVKLFLDFDEKNQIICNILFCYKEVEFNPIDETINQVCAVRSVIDESNCLNLLRKTGFLIDKKNARFILADEEEIYHFLSEDINEYMQKFEVLITDNFKEKQIKQPKLGSLGVKVENNLLHINLENLNFDKNELKEILEEYSLKKKYHRLKDGTFFTLEQNEDLDFLEGLLQGSEIDYKELAKNEIHLPMYRSLYLEKILENMKHTQIHTDTSYTDFVKQVEQTQISAPYQLEHTLRYYQKTGFSWLKTLDLYSLGGILADDMGLGKTLQIISLMLSYKNEETKEKKPILVVCPSSLSLNWNNEIEKFASNLSTLVISGNLATRKFLIKNILEYDVIITSYDLLKRDVDLYTEANYEFRYIIADEAQYMKNSNTQNARAIKQIRAQTRFALTGTPIENSLSELWSIFDFIMPGYLFSYKKFKERFELPIVRDEHENAMNRLKKLIEPFVLRRTKKEVLTELPDKTITVLNNEMEEEQQKIYLSYLAQAKTELQEELQAKGLDSSRIKILALLTRLRQICCHPSLFLHNYQGGSSKLNQCMEIVNSAIEAGHKILLFSNYTSMFELLEKEFKKEHINYFKLTGQTKVSQRIDLVDEFNSNPDIKVFLISLKAGGTGLNLVGADMVIHYDPWWNISAENQATDRAYRIGQKNNVQVYKLITKNSIEEKIFELQNKKSALIEHVLDTNTSFISHLSKEDVLALFE